MASNYVKKGILVDVALQVAKGMHEYSCRLSEFHADAMYLGYLRGMGFQVKRQHPVHSQAWKRPKRIDFRCGTTNPTLVELAWRPKKGGQGLEPRQNSSELQKLTRFKGTRVRLRALVLVDLAKGVLERDELEPLYRSSHAGRGQFARHSVRVIYAHHSGEQYDFLWKPRVQD